MFNHVQTMSRAVRCFSMTATKSVKPARKIKLRKNTQNKFTSFVEQSESLVLYKDSKLFSSYSSAVEAA